MTRRIIVLALVLVWLGAGVIVAFILAWSSHREMVDRSTLHRSSMVDPPTVLHLRDARTRAHPDARRLRPRR